MPGRGFRSSTRAHAIDIAGGPAAERLMTSTRGRAREGRRAGSGRCYAAGCLRKGAHSTSAESPETEATTPRPQFGTRAPVLSKKKNILTVILAGAAPSVWHGPDGGDSPDRQFGALVRTARQLPRGRGVHDPSSCWRWLPVERLPAWLPRKEATHLAPVATQVATEKAAFLRVYAFVLPAMSGDSGRAARLAGGFGCWSINPAICHPPRLIAGSGVVTPPKEVRPCTHYHSYPIPNFHRAGPRHRHRLRQQAALAGYVVR